MSYNATNDRIVVRKISPDKLSGGGIILPWVEAEAPELGEVVSVGPGVTSKKGVFIPTVINVGEKVYFDKKTGIPIRLNGEDLLIMKEDEVLGVAEE